MEFVSRMVTQAINNKLPEGFKSWEVVINDRGDTIAHLCAQLGNLPDDYNDWWITNFQGKTVAAAAAESGHIPENFHFWNIQGRNGIIIHTN